MHKLGNRTTIRRRGGSFFKKIIHIENVGNESKLLTKIRNL